MEQYFCGREQMHTEEIPADCQQKIENKYFVNERVDSSWKKAHLYINNSTFATMGFRDSKFEQCNLSFCVFIDCYFKRAHFEQTKFISCIFINCNFDMATFINCDFRYASFENCYIRYEQMVKNLPHGQDNLCADICRNLSLQCLNLGQINDYKAYLFEERSAGEAHEIKKLFHENGSYYKKYTLWEGIKGFCTYIRSKLSKFLWGYGEKMSILIRNILCLIVLYGCIYFFLSNHINWGNLSNSTFISAMYLSASTFFSGTSEYVFNTGLAKCFELSERILGLILMGFFGAALFRQINRR